MIGVQDVKDTDQRSKTLKDTQTALYVKVEDVCGFLLQDQDGLALYGRKLHQVNYGERCGLKFTSVNFFLEHLRSDKQKGERV